MKTVLFLIIIVLTLSISLLEIPNSFAAYPGAPGAGSAPANVRSIFGAGTATQSTAGFAIPVGTDDKLLVLGIGYHQNAAQTIDRVELRSVGTCAAGGAGAGIQTFEKINAAEATIAATTFGNIHTEIYILRDTAGTPMHSGTGCIVDVTINAGTLGVGNLASGASSFAFDVVLFSDVDQTNPISTTGSATGTSTDATVSLNTNEHNFVFNIATSEAGGGAAPTPTGTDAARVAEFSVQSTVDPDRAVALSFAQGTADPASTAQGWTFGAVDQWAISAVAIRSNSDDSVTADSTSTSGGGGGGRSGCDGNGDCTPPTLGVNEEGQRLVEGGFTYNDNTIDSELFYTPFPLITTTVGEQNIAVFKIFDNKGADDITHFELAFGLRTGEIIGDSLAKIIWDRTWEGIESVTFEDPQNVFSNVDLDVSKGACRADSNNVEDCLVITVTHTFRKPLDFDIVGTSIWDSRLNQWSNYFNHGVRITGDSLDPPPTVTTAFGTKEMRGLYELTQLDSKTDIWVDEFGNVYQNHGNNFFEKISVLKQGIVTDYVKLHESEAANNIINQELAEFMSSYYKTSIDSDVSFSEINNIKTIKSDEMSDDLHSANLIDMINYEKTKAETILQQLCEKCNDSEFTEINDIKYFNYPETHGKLDNPTNQKILHEEYLKSIETFNKYYGYIYNDELILLEPAVITYDKNIHVDKNMKLQNEQSRAEQLLLSMYGTMTDFD